MTRSQRGSNAALDQPQWLHLFTSTIRALYIADAVDLLAAPAGTHYRFRYDSCYVSGQLREQWGSPALKDRPVAVHFSLQHPARYHQATYVPLRTGTVVGTETEGNTLVVIFRLGDYAPLDPTAKTDSERADRVREFTAQLIEMVGENHPDAPDGFSALEGADPSSLYKSNGEQGAYFQTVVTYLTPCLYFSPRLFFRVATVTDDATGENIDLKNGDLYLTAGRRYTLMVGHYQPVTPPAEARIEIDTPDGIEMLGAPTIAIRSRYDLSPVRVFAKNRDDAIAIELRLRAEGPLPGAKVHLPVVVAPSNLQTAAWPVLGVGGAVALAVPPILASDTRIGLRLFIALLGAALVGAGGWLRRQRGLSP